MERKKEGKPKFMIKNRLLQCWNAIQTHAKMGHFHAQRNPRRNQKPNKTSTEKKSQNTVKPIITTLKLRDR